VSEETYTVTIDVVWITDAAVRVSDGDRTVWLPMSEIVNMRDVEESLIVGAMGVELELPVWLLREKELV
jgi:hypothetical protein